MLLRTAARSKRKTRTNARTCARARYRLSAAADEYMWCARARGHPKCCQLDGRDRAAERSPGSGSRVTRRRWHDCVRAAPSAGSLIRSISFVAAAQMFFAAASISLFTRVLSRRENFSFFLFLVLSPSPLHPSTNNHSRRFISKIKSERRAVAVQDVRLRVPLLAHYHRVCPDVTDVLVCFFPSRNALSAL